MFSQWYKASLIKGKLRTKWDIWKYGNVKTFTILKTDIPTNWDWFEELLQKNSIQNQHSEIN